MAVLKPRNKILVLRLSQEEYEALRTISRTKGARNLSDFTRSALLAVVARGDSTDHDPLQDVYRAISTLQDLVGRMAEKIDHMATQDTPSQKEEKA